MFENSSCINQDGPTTIHLERRNASVTVTVTQKCRWHSWGTVFSNGVVRRRHLSNHNNQIIYRVAQKSKPLSWIMITSY